MTDKLKKEKKTDSFIFNITVAAIGYLLLMVIILSAVSINTTRTLEDNAGSTMEQIADITDYEIDEVLRANEQALALVLQNNENIKVFENGTETQRAIAAQNMLQLLKNAALAGADINTLFFYDLINDTYIARISDDTNYSDSTAIEKGIRELNEEYPDNMPNKWFYRQMGEKKYLLRLYKNKKRMLGAIVPLSKLKGGEVINEVVSYTFMDDEGNIIDQFGYGDYPDQDTVYEAVKGAVFDEPIWVMGRKFLVFRDDTKRGDFDLLIGMTRKAVYGNYQTLQIVIISLVLAAILMLVALALYARAVVYAPLAELLSSMKRIEQGDQEVRLTDEAKTREFKQINSSFNRMMDTIVNLKMKSYEERIQFDEATLKYVQLQIKPHFFLNALTTIHSMSYQDRGDDIREYIERLSRNVRYLFKAGLHTVPLSEEVDHARDYIAMQDILYPGSVFDYIEVDEELSDYAVPQLIIHTILENIYKHAVSVDNLTSILISAHLEDKEDEKMCHICVEDDGEGFPAEFLEQVQADEMTVKENGQGIGLWNMKKTLSLMYRRDDLIVFSNKEPHGSKVDIWIPRRVKRQSSVWKI